MLGDDPHPSAGPWRTKGGRDGGARPQVEVYPTQYGGVTQVLTPPYRLRDGTRFGVPPPG